MKLTQLILAFILCTLFNNSWSQTLTPSEEFDLYKKKYPDENAVFLKYEDKVNIELTKDKNNPLKVTATNIEELFLLNDNAAYFADRVLSSSHYAMLSDFDVYSLNPEEKKYKKIKVKDILTGQSSDGMIFYDSVVEKRIYFSDVKKGTKTYISHTTDYPEPRMLRPYFFQSFSPANEISLQITLPADVTLKWKIYNNDNNAIQLTTEEKKGKIIYTFKAVNTPRIKSESSSPNIRYFVPHLFFWIDSYKFKGAEVSYLSNPQALYDWKKKYLHGAPDSVSPQLKNIVDSLTAGETDELKKVKSIFYWVQDHIKYVAFEAGLEGFVPRPAAKVCDRRYGDCKDMASIIVAMLRIAHIPGYMVWIGSRDLPYKYSVTPLPNISNHMIAMYKNGKENIFLDATGQFVPFGKPTSFIQGKEGFVSIDENHY
ncbi:MAG: transglutaminase domain-containing protein, partial [Bacteroidetes bacterium]|nr:transglutaminase domain-containing protein [Bacteroidota bacterium]